MIVCLCENVSTSEIQEAVEEGIETMEELTRELGVSGSCGRCRTCAEGILKDCKRASAGKPEIAA